MPDDDHRTRVERIDEFDEIGGETFEPVWSTSVARGAAAAEIDGDRSNVGSHCSDDVAPDRMIALPAMNEEQRRFTRAALLEREFGAVLRGKVPHRRDFRALRRTNLPKRYG